MSLQRSVVRLLGVLALLGASLWWASPGVVSAGAAHPADAAIDHSLLTCSSFTAEGTATPGGFAAVRVWKNTNTGTPLVDSYEDNGVPTKYSPIRATGHYNVAVSFAAQPAGTKLVGRIYRAPAATFGSYDLGKTQDITVTCGVRGGTSISGSALTCSSFNVAGIATPASGFAALRVWKDSFSGTPLVDSYENHGVPSDYSTIQSDGSYTAAATFAAQPVGTKLIARVYRAPNAAFSSWDLGTYQDVTVTCAATSGATIGASTLICSNFTVTGTATPASGYAAVRVWIGAAGGTPLIDSFDDHGVPTRYSAIQPDGTYNLAVSFAAQPAGTKLVARIYRALVADFDSFDDGDYQDVSVTCAETPGATIDTSTLTCSSFTIAGKANPANGYAAVRVWKNSFATPLVDSYDDHGVPTDYAPIQSDGTYNTTVSFAPQVAGTKLIGRIYRAPAAAFDSYDGGITQDVTVLCVGSVWIPVVQR